MKKLNTFTIIVLSLFILNSGPLYAKDGESWLTFENEGETTSKYSIGAKSHFDYGNFKRIPLEEEDISYLLFYEVHNNFAYWQIGGSYSPEPDDKRFEHVITPQINLIGKDRFYRLGVGALTSSVKKNGDSDWTRVYYQVIAGIGIPIGDYFGIDIYGHYLFESWQKIGEPASEAPEVSVMINFTF